MLTTPNSEISPRRAWRLALPVALVVALLVALLLAASGCNVLGVMAAKSLPPPRRPAAYELGEASVAVRVEPAPRIYGADGPTDAEAVAAATERALRDYTKATVRAEDAARIVGVVLDPPSAETLAGSDLRTGRASATVRVLDAQARELWPLDGTAGRRVEVQTPRTTGGDDADVRRATLRSLGQSIASLFHPVELDAAD